MMVCPLGIVPQTNSPSKSSKLSSANFATDDWSLRSCALTCHAWHVRSRSHLLRAIPIHGCDQLKDVCSYLAVHRNSTSVPRGRLLPSVVSLTLSGLRYILHTSSAATESAWRHPIALHSVTLTYLQTHTCLDFGTFSSPTSLFRLICALPKLEHLEFGESLGMSMSDSASQSAWKSSFGKSTRLRSHVVSYHGCKDAFRFDC